MRLALLALSLCACTYAQCTFTLTTPVTNFPAAGGTGVVTVTASASDCTRPASTTVDWITIAFGQTGEGNGTVGFTVAANTTPANRNGSIVVGSQSLTITQAGAECAFSLSSNSISVGSSATTGSFTLNGSNACTWNANANAGWLHVTSATSGIGSSTITYSVDANASRNSRNGTIIAGGQTFTVTQAGTCVYTLDPGSSFYPVAGGTGTFSVSSQTGCNWTATSTAAWITITFGQSGTANGSVGYTVDANATVARGASIQVANQTFAITQDGVPCAVTLSAPSANFGVSGGSGSVGVSGPSSCAWTASTGASWIRLTSGTSGTGNGSVGFSVLANSGPQARSDLINIGGQSFVVIQSGGTCKYEISPASRQFPAGGGGALVSVNTTAGCPWTATTNAGWITITNVDGSGAGSAGYTVAANPDSNPRSGTIVVADQTHSVTQSAGTCTVELDPLSAKADAAGGSDAISLISSCAWAAASKTAWITVTPTSGTGRATLTWTAAANSVPKARSGTIVAGSQTFSILQAAAPCNLSLSGNAATVGSNGGTGTIQVTAVAGCDWSPGSNVAWIKFSWASVNGSGNVNYTVEPNPGVAPRTGVLTILGQRFTVTQDAPRFLLSSNAVVAHAASLIAGPVSPGLIVTLFVPGAGPSTPVTAQLTGDRRAITTSLGDTRVLFNGVAAPMVYASDTQISAIVPYQVAGAASAEMLVEYRGARSNVVSVPVVAAAPGIFTVNSSGAGSAVVLNQNLSLNTAANPAARNSIVVFYASGEGQTNPAGADGRLAPTTATGLARPVLPVSVLIDGQEAPILYAGATPGQVAGLMQVNARVPAGVTPGNVSLVLRVGQFESRPAVTFWVQ